MYGYGIQQLSMDGVMKNQYLAVFILLAFGLSSCGGGSGSNDTANGEEGLVVPTDTGTPSMTPVTPEPPITPVTPEPPAAIIDIPSTPTPPSSIVVDSDTDGVGDDVDNCPLVANVEQFDTDFDNIGDACDDDCILCADLAAGISVFPIESTSGAGFIDGVIVNGVNATPVDGFLFREESNSITLQSSPDGLEVIPVISGGSSEFTISSNTEFTGVFVRMGTDMDFFAQLDQPTTSATIIAIYSSFEGFPFIPVIGFQVQAASGLVNPELLLQLDPQETESGDVQVSVSWDQPTDVDLFLQEPSGEFIFFDNIQSETGGRLDLDSNPACVIDGINNENIVYSNTIPPSGTYLVAINYYDNCSVLEPTNYVVTVRANGEITSFSGSFLPSDVNADDIFNLTEITRFTLP